MGTMAVPVSAQGADAGRSLTLFVIDRELDELLDAAGEEAEGNAGQISDETKQAIEAYLEAFHKKVDAIARYIRYQEVVAEVARREEQRLAARKRAAENRVKSLKEMLVYFLLARGLKKISGELNTISVQRNGQPSIVIEDPLSIADCFREASVRLCKTDLEALAAQLPTGELRERLERALQKELETNPAAVRAALLEGHEIVGARLVTGHHIRLR